MGLLQVLCGFWGPPYSVSKLFPLRSKKKNGFLKKEHLSLTQLLRRNLHLYPMSHVPFEGAYFKSIVGVAFGEPFTTVIPFRPKLVTLGKRTQ